MNLLCEVDAESGITTDDVPKGEKRKRRNENRRREETNSGKGDQAKKRASEDKCKKSDTDGNKDDNHDNGDNQPLSKRVRLARYRRSSSTTPAAISTPISKTPSERSSQRDRLWCRYRSKRNWLC